MLSAVGDLPKKNKVNCIKTVKQEDWLLVLRITLLCFIVFTIFPPMTCIGLSEPNSGASPLVSASYLIWKGDQLLSSGDPKSAIDCYVLASSHLESSPLPHFKMARAYLRTSLANAFFETVIALKLLSNDFSSQSLILSNVLIVLLIGLGVALYSGVLAIVLRHSPTVFTSISNLRIGFIRRLAPEILLVAIIVSILIVMPAKSFLGILTWSLTIGAGLTWRYATAGEKRVMVFFAAYLIAIGPAIGFVAKVVSTQHPHSPMRLLSIATAIDSTTMARIIEDMKTDRSQPNTNDLIKGHYYLQSCRFEEAATIFEDLSKREENNVVILNNLAVSLFRLGHYQQSRNVLESAIRLSPNDAILHYNYAQVLNALLDFTSAEEEISKASTLDFPLIRSMLTSKAQTGPIPITLRHETLWANSFSQTDYPLKLSYHPIESGKIGILILSSVIVGCLLVTYKSRPSPKCNICGMPMKRIYTRRSLSEMTCRSCNKILQGFSDHKLAEDQCKRRSRSIARKKTMATILFGLIFPGSSYYLIGKRLKGFLVTFSFACLATLLLSRGSVVGPLPKIGMKSTPQNLMLFTLALYFVYATRMVLTILKTAGEEKS